MQEATALRSNDPAHRAAEISARYRAALDEAEDCALALLSLGIDPASAISPHRADLSVVVP